MKLRFSTLDIIAILPELKAKICTGWRVNQVFDCDYKTYIFKLNKSIVQMKKDNDPLSVNETTENKMTFIIESGLRIHSTDYDWPKSHAPGQFATKLRKFLRNKRVEDISQVGIDRIIDIRFGSQNLANHLLIELYDRGNLVLTDYNYCIVAVLRWRKPEKKSGNSEKNEVEETDGFKVGQTYPIDRCRKQEDLEVMSEDRIVTLLNATKDSFGTYQKYKKRQKAKQDVNSETLEVNLKDLLNPRVIYGSSLLEDKLLKHLGKPSAQSKCTIQIPMDKSGQLDQSKVKEYAAIIRAALDEAELVLKEVQTKQLSPGYIVQKVQTDTSQSNGTNDKKTKKNSNKSDKEGAGKSTLTTNVDFFPIQSCAERKLQQESNLSIQEFESFDKAVDIYYTNMEAQKIDSRAFSAEKEARKKLENLKIAQEKRLNDLARAQKDDEEKARLVELNCDKVEDALLIMRSMIANQMPWSDIRATIKEAQSKNDPIASLIVGVNFDRNEFTMKLSDPYGFNDENSNSDDNRQKSKQDFRNIDIDIGLSAFANARKFFDKRRNAVDKERKTLEVSKKAFKNVERRTKEMLKDVVIKTGISKARKRYWFENFFWFISTDGYLVVGGRDAEQNDLLVKRYMKTNDIYVHADLHGAASVIIKNEFSTPVPPKTLNEAGTFAVCYSSAWDAKIACASWWVYPKQVTKSAPSGEYLTSGAFIIRGKKNYLQLSSLVLGFGFLFRLGDESIDRRRQSRLAKERTEPVEDNSSSVDDTENHDGDDRSLSVDSEDADNDDGNPTEQPSEGSPDPIESSRTLETITEQTTTKNEEYEDEELEEEDGKLTEHRLVDTITESPLADDIILYAIPMCGPYSSFQSFKYKVKIIPGNHKRGKAAKSCLGLFLHDKNASQRERDLLRALKDQDYARNIPNKVKISAPNMKTMTKRRPKRSEVSHHS